MKLCLPRWFIFGLAIMVSHASGGNEPVPVPEPSPVVDLTVQDVIVLALKNSRTLDNARRYRSVDQLALQIAEAEFRPDIRLGASTQDTEAADATDSSRVFSAIRLRVPTGGELAVSSSVSDDALTSFNASPRQSIVELTFTQPLLRGAGLSVAQASLRNARLQEMTNQLNFEATVMRLITSVLSTYRSYLQALRRETIAMRSLTRAQELLEVNQLLVQTGRMADRDVIQAEADIARRELDVISTQGNLDAARLQLVDVLDLDSSTQFGTVDELSSEEDATNVMEEATALEIALANRPDYKIGELMLSTAENQLKVAKNDRLWDLSLTVGRSFRGSSDSFTNAFDDLANEGERVSLDLNIPVGRNAAGVLRLNAERAAVNLKVAENQLAEIVQGIEIEVNNALRNLVLAERRLDLAIKAKDLAQEKTDIEREKLNLGVTTNFQLVAFENDLVFTENAELDAYVGRLNAVTDLQQTLGLTLQHWGIDIERVELNADNDAQYGVGE